MHHHRGSAGLRTDGVEDDPGTAERAGPEN